MGNETVYKCTKCSFVSILQPAVLTHIKEDHKGNAGVVEGGTFSSSGGIKRSKGQAEEAPAAKKPVSAAKANQELLQRVATTMDDVSQSVTTMCQIAQNQTSALNRILKMAGDTSRSPSPQPGPSHRRDKSPQATRHGGGQELEEEEEEEDEEEEEEEEEEVGKLPGVIKTRPSKPESDD